MICLKNRTFAVSQTSIIGGRLTSKWLWFAWKIVLLQYHKHPISSKLYSVSVVICLKNRTFAVSQTSQRLNVRIGVMLWFAWKIVLLQYHKHLHKEQTFPHVCCDLLEKSYFCSITNITKWVIRQACRVVICLKNRTFAVSQTSDDVVEQHHRALWFAWKIVLLQYHKHLKYHIYLYYKQIQRFKK